MKHVRGLCSRLRHFDAEVQDLCKSRAVEERKVQDQILGAVGRRTMHHEDVERETDELIAVAWRACEDMQPAVSGASDPLYVSYEQQQMECGLDAFEEEEDARDEYRDVDEEYASLNW